MPETAEQQNVAMAWEFLGTFLSPGADPEYPYAMSLGDIPEYRAALDDVLDPEIVIDLAALGAGLAPGLRERYRGTEQAWDFWRTWLESWDDYRFRIENMEPRGDHVVYEMDVAAKSATMGIEVTTHIAQVFTWRDGKVLRYAMFPTRSDALDAVERGDLE
jgi:ketosteroid isomerase-like protein